ncbi:tripartite tricarboxylate transporter substrate binding protein [Hydrogenophaga sp.]|uniref:Bug family tripartite tricarboxylate transporter substrate binding protein n=1 Tax=Hydrogenophaga sp. TaxID=1904254 RepID=UPI002717EC4F|nr:tripartite tricarboxylate transporter substrate binding protein [Hydrogenophaga sp.]MDO9434371.1 tripartite tricarboxylate transporter substrate binding protein [Hydrogenophaga sp.]
MNHINILRKLGLVTVLCAAAPWAQAQATYPHQPITMVVPYPAGGAADAMGRIIGRSMGTSLGQTVIIDNRPGAGGNIGTAQAAKAPADGHTVLLAQLSPIVINPHTYTKLTIDPVKDLIPVGVISQNPMVLVVRPGLPVKTVAELVAYSKANPGKLNYASSGSGSINHVAMELLKTNLGVDMAHIPYKGGAPALQDMLGGRVDVMIDAVVQLMPMIKSGQLRALAITGPQRVESAPDIPTTTEAGIPNYVLYGWMGVFAPAGTPPAVVKQLKSALDTAITSEAFKTFVLGSGAQLIKVQSTEAFAQLVTEDYSRWGKVVKAADIKAD